MSLNTAGGRILNEIVDWSRRVRSALDSRARCERCRLSWTYREPQWIRDSRSSEAAPLCTECFSELNPILATRYYTKMWFETWERGIGDDYREHRLTFLQYAIFEKMGTDGEVGGGDPLQEAREWAL